MNYIQKLQTQRNTLLEFFHGFVELDVAQRKFENTAYKGDAQRIVVACYAKLNGLRKEIEANVLPTIKQEEK